MKFDPRSRFIAYLLPSSLLFVYSNVVLTDRLVGNDLRKLPTDAFIVPNIIQM